MQNFQMYQFSQAILTEDRMHMASGRQSYLWIALSQPFVPEGV